jgi:hypothetical protein
MCSPLQLDRVFGRCPDYLFGFNASGLYLGFLEVPIGIFAMLNSVDNSVRIEDNVHAMENHRMWSRGFAAEDDLHSGLKRLVLAKQDF